MGSRSSLSTSIGETVFWSFFGIYAATALMWLLLANATLFWPSLVPGHAANPHADTAPWVHEEDLLLSIGTLLLGLFLVWLAPQNITARWLGVGLVGTAAGFSLTAHHFLMAVASDTMQRITFAPVPIIHLLFHLIAGVAYTGALLLFPDGKAPRMSTTTLLTLWTALCGVLVALIAFERQPTYFILYCGVVGVGAGWFAQWHKSKYNEDPQDRARSEMFRTALSHALRVAAVISVVVIALWIPFHRAGLTGAALRESFLTALIFGSIPPLLAAVGIVVVVGILQYRLWGIESIPNGPNLLKVVILIVMISYVVAEVAVHTITEEFGDKVGVSLTLCAPIAVTVGLALLERPREYVVVSCRRLLYGTVVNPQRVFAEFKGELANSLAPEAVTPALASVLRRGMDVIEGRLTVAFADGTQRSYAWPPDAAVTHEELPLLLDGDYLGHVATGLRSHGPMTPAERQLVIAVAAQAALAIRARTAAASQPGNASAPSGTGTFPDTPGRDVEPTGGDR